MPIGTRSLVVVIGAFAAGGASGVLLRPDIPSDTASFVVRLVKEKRVPSQKASHKQGIARIYLK